MTHVTCRLTAKNRDQPRNPTLGNGAWATFTFLDGTPHSMECILTACYNETGTEMIMGWVDPWVEDDEDDSVSSRRRCSHLASAVDVATGRW